MKTITFRSRLPQALLLLGVLTLCVLILFNTDVQVSSAQVSAVVGQIQGYGGQCLDLPYADTTDGSNIEMYTCNGSKAQEWILSGGQLSVKGKCLSIEGTARQGAYVEVRSCQNDGHPSWYMTDAGEIRSDRYPNLCLDVAYAGTEPKTKVWMYGCNQTGAQKWLFPAPVQTTVGPIEGVGGQCLDLPYADTTNGSNIEMYTCNQSKAQEWQLRHGQLSVKGKCLAIEGDAREGAFVEIQSCENTRLYAWYLNGKNQIKSSLHPALCLEVQDSGTTPKTKVWMAVCKDTSAQKWLYPAAGNPAPPPSPPSPPNPAPSHSNIAVRLHGTTGTERVALYVDGNFRSETVATTGWRTWTMTVIDSPESVEQVEVRFTNDGRYNGVDKNVRVDWITFDGQTIQAESPDVYSEGAWNRANGCGPGRKQVEWLHCQNAFFRFMIAGDSTEPTQEIANSDIVFEFDPNVPLLQRTSGQIIAVGDTFNVGVTAGRDFNTRISDSRIESFRMEDGTTLRYGRVPDPVYPNRTVIEYAAQWKENDGYAYQPGMHNSSVDPSNDPLFFDGTRVQTSYLDNSERFGIGDTLWQVFTVRLDAGLIQADDNKLYNQWHAPDEAGGLSPMLSWHVNKGQCEVSVLYWESNRPTQQNRHDEQYPFDCTDSWEDWIVRVEFQNDDRGQLEVWRRIDGGSWQEVVARHNRPFGANFSGLQNGSALNDKNYVSHSYYSWHSGNLHDETVPVRRLWWAWSGLIKDPQHKYTFNDVAAYLEDHR